MSEHCTVCQAAPRTHRVCCHDPMSGQRWEATTGPDPLGPNRFGAIQPEFCGPCAQAVAATRNSKVPPAQSAQAWRSLGLAGDTFVWSPKAIAQAWGAPEGSV